MHPLPSTASASAHSAERLAQTTNALPDRRDSPAGTEVLASSTNVLVRLMAQAMQAEAGRLALLERERRRLATSRARYSSD